MSIYLFIMEGVSIGLIAGYVAGYILGYDRAKGLFARSPKVLKRYHL